MASSIINSDDGSVSGTTGLKTTGGDDGVLEIQTVGTTAITIDASQNVTIDGLTVGQGAGNVASNTAVGKDALDANTTGARNTAVGESSLSSVTSGARNTGVGRATLFANTGSDNTGVGQNSLASNTTGNYNTGLGSGSLEANTTASSNTAVGYQALYDNTTGYDNTAVGTCLYNNTEGYRNTAMGRYALSANTTGDDNVSIGNSSLGNSTTASFNTSVGYASLNALTTGQINTAVGWNSGSAITTGSKNTIIGAYNGNQGGLDIRTSSNNIVLSDGDGNPRLYYTGADNSWKSIEIYNGTTGSAANMVSLSSGTIARSTSSLKYKRDIQDATHGLAEVMQLRPITYKGKSALDGETVFGGLIAEEVHDAGLTEFVQYAPDGTPDALSYGNMVALAFKAIQELNAKVDAQAAEIAILKGA